MVTKKDTMADNDSGGRQQHASARLGGGLSRGRTRAGGKRQRRHWSGDDGCGSRRWQQRTTMAVVEDDGEGGWQQQRRTTATDDNGTQDWVADYEGEGGERAANNNGIRHKAEKPAGQRA